MSYKGYKITINDRKTGNFNHYTFFSLPVFYCYITRSRSVLKKRKKTRNQKIPKINLLFISNNCSIRINTSIDPNRAIITNKK